MIIFVIPVLKVIVSQAPRNEQSVRIIIFWITLTTLRRFYAWNVQEGRILIWEQLE